MSRTYLLDILTPEHPFFSGQVEALTVYAPDGSITVLGGHAPLITPLEAGSLQIKTEGQWKEAFHAEGFMEVTRTGVVVFAQSCEWPENIDPHRALEAKLRAEERLRQRQSIKEHKLSQLALTRAMARLHITRHK
jgi:F-type H+-transporting ATPase subunit epsilon